MNLKFFAIFLIMILVVSFPMQSLIAGEGVFGVDGENGSNPNGGNPSNPNSGKLGPIMERMFGFQYPLDTTAEYLTDWIDHFDIDKIENDFKAIRDDFPDANLLRIPIDWYEMNETQLPTNMELVIALGKEYDFKFIFVLFNVLSGWLPAGMPLAPQNYLPANWTDHEDRLTNTVEPFKDETQIYAWALENEANVFQQVVVEWFEHFIPFLKNLDPDTPVCTSFYYLGLNSTTLSRSSHLVDLGLDFIEFHWYPTDTDNITRRIDEIVGYVDAPLFISEFGVYHGLNTYDVETNKQILQEEIEEFDKRLNIIGLAYYRWSNDTDEYTIWNYTSQTVRSEAEIINTYGKTFLKLFPHASLIQIQSSNQTYPSVFDSSFETIIEYPNYDGWLTWNNNTSFDLLNVTTAYVNTTSPQNVELSNPGFEQNNTDWFFEPILGDQNWDNETSIVYDGDISLKLWAASTEDNQMQHTNISITENWAYVLEGYVKVTETTAGGYAFLQLAFRNEGEEWLHYVDSVYVNVTTDWARVIVTGIAPTGSNNVLVNCRARAEEGGQSVTAYFDYLSLRKIQPAAYDGKSYMLGWARGSAEGWDEDLRMDIGTQIDQNFTFANPTEDVQKIWTFSCSIAVVQSDEYITDWKGSLVQIAFTGEDKDDWLTWYDSEYKSHENVNWTTLTVSGVPPLGAKGIVMIVKAKCADWGVVFIDNAVLESRHLVVPDDFSVTGDEDSYTLNLTITALNTTAGQGTLNLGASIIEEANCTFDYIPENYDITITDMEGCGNWVFAEEKYYTFRARYQNLATFDFYFDNTTTLILSFSMELGDTSLGTMKIKFSDGSHEIIAVYDGAFSLESGEDVVFLKGTFTIVGSLLQADFGIYFTNKILDSLNVSIWMSYEISGYTTGWELKAEDYFNIYSIGGFSLTFNTFGDAGRIEGGDVFDLYATNGSWVETEVIFRNLQHIKMVPSIYFGDMEAVNPPWRLEYRFDYCTAEDDDWITGFGVKIYPVFGIIGSGAEGGRYQTYNVTLFNRGEIIESLNMSCYLRYDQTTYGGIGEGKFIFDLWFNKVNASSTCGVRVNAYEYAMIDRSSPWISWLVGTEWVPYEGLRKDVMLFDTLLDDANETLYVPEIKLVRLYCKLEQQYPEIPFRTEVRDYEIWDLTFDPSDPFQGVQTPQMDDTKVPFVYGGGLLGSLWSALQGIWVEYLGPGLLIFWEIFVGFLDTIAGALGFPNFFSNLFDWIAEIFGYMAESAGYIAAILLSIFTLIGTLLGSFLTVMGDIITAGVNTITMFTDMMGGAYGVGVNIWDTLGISQWITVAIIFYPLYLIILWDQEGMDAVISQLSMMFGILSWLFIFFVSLIQFTIGLITTVIESIPVAE